MSTTPSPIPGLPPGRPREELLKALASRYPGTRSGFDKSRDWTPEVDRERDREDDDDDRDREEDKPARRTTRYGGEHMAKANGWDMNDYDCGHNVAKFLTAVGRQVEVEWYYVTATRWKHDPRSKEPGWIVTRVTFEKIVVMRVNA